MNASGRGCHPQPLPSGNADNVALPAVAPLYPRQFQALDTPVVMQSPDWRTMPNLESSTAPCNGKTPDRELFPDADGVPLILAGAVYVLEQASSTPLRVLPLDANATWGWAMNDQPSIN